MIIESEAHIAAIERARERMAEQAAMVAPQPTSDEEPDTRPLVIAPLYGTRGIQEARVAVPQTWAERIGRKRHKLELGYRVRLFAANRLRFLARVRSFLSAITGGKVDAEAYRDRMAECMECPHRIAEIRERRGSVRELWYCAACQCPRWKLARLTFKNRLKRWYCPARKHAGPYPDDAVRRYLVQRGHATEDQLKAVGGCRGCGG